jgi:hypothetical protein
MMLVLMYFFTKTIGTLIDIIPRQVMKTIPSFLDFVKWLYEAHVNWIRLYFKLKIENILEIKLNHFKK